jgi:membrane-associated protein
MSQPDAEALQRRPTLPWEGRAQRADLVCAGGILLSVVYALALLPVQPQLLGRDPVLLELLSGSLPGMVAAGALARVGGTSLLLAVSAGVLGTVMFDPFYWWAGRLWGRRGAHLLAGGNERSKRWIERGERLGGRWGKLSVIVAYYLPIPSVLVYALVGWTGMRLATFIVCDLIGALLWTGLIVGLGYALGQGALDVAHAITHYSLLATIVLTAAVIARQAWVRGRR